MTYLERLEKKLKTLSETIWEGRADEKQIDTWLTNFSASPDGERREHLHALHLLSQFMYFGQRQIRELLKSLYRDTYKYAIVEAIRKRNGDTTNLQFLSSEFTKELSTTRFLGMGNPSESGPHLLYYFRQENQLPKKLFIHAHEIFKVDRTGQLILADDTVKRYVFIDDFCGSGTQASRYSSGIIKNIKRLDSSVQVAYYPLMATSQGLNRVRSRNVFGRVECVLELDSSFKCFSSESRYFTRGDTNISKRFAYETNAKHGRRIVNKKQDHLGFKDGQLLVGFFHNVPNNTLPIFWSEANNWKPIFKRYPKY